MGQRVEIEAGVGRGRGKVVGQGVMMGAEGEDWGRRRWGRGKGRGRGQRVEKDRRWCKCFGRQRCVWTKLKYLYY